MPPQVSGPGSGNRNIAGQCPNEVNEAKSDNLQTKPPETQQTKPEPSTPRNATPKEKAEKNIEKAIDGSIRQSLLNEKLHAKEKSAAEIQKEITDQNNLQQATEQTIKNIGKGISSPNR